MMKIDSEFNLYEKVKIIPLDVEGEIISLWLTAVDRLQIEVRYFINNEKKTEYFIESELKKIKENKIGF